MMVDQRVNYHMGFSKKQIQCVCIGYHHYDRERES